MGEKQRTVDGIYHFPGGSRGARNQGGRPTASRLGRAEQGPTYSHYDTHWTPRGAIAGFNAIAEADGHPDWRIEADGALKPWIRPGGDLAA